MAAWKQAGQTVVFTNGCFDVLHRGHVELLKAARGFGDQLVVGLNSDRSVTELKGPHRPIQTAEDRAVILEALRSVDLVIIFDEPTPLKLIQLLKPQILVKGGDYASENIVGAREVQSWGGRVEIIPLVPGQSTTALVKKISRL